MNYTPEEIISLILLNSENLTQEQADAFSAWVRENPEHARLFIQSALLHRGIRDHFCNTDITSRQLIESGLSDLPGESQSPFEDKLWAELSRQEKDAPSLKIQKTEQKVCEVQEVQPFQQTSPVSRKGYLWFSIISIAASFLLVLYVWTHPRHIPQDVATIIDVFEGKWDQPDVMLQKGVRLFDNRKPIALQDGILKIQFDNGVQVVVESPAIFSIEAYERMRLSAGKLFAKVPEQGIGFRVNAPNCGVIDLGTEFGMQVSSRGETSVHLFKGKASLVTSAQQQVQQSQILEKNQAAGITPAGTIESIAFQDRTFVRDFNSESKVLWNGDNLDLASITAGGNGLSRVQDRGIDPATGILVSGNVEEQNREKTDKYVPVPEIRYVDGVFIPDGEKGPVQLTSAGHLFDGFGDTTGDYFMCIGTYSSVYMYGYSGSERSKESIHLPGFMEETSINLCLHANSGITYDLQRIRESMPFINITGFSSVYGVPKTLKHENSAADFYVFVDGKLKMEKKGVSCQDEPAHVSIPLTNSSRFLTLVCTEGDMNYGDWSVFVNPVLELELAN